MQSNNSNGSCATWTRRFMVVFAVLAMGLALMASPAAGAPFAYVTNHLGGTVSVIDTATNPPSVVATVPLGSTLNGVAVTPDGKHVYVGGSVIDTATNKVVATGGGGFGVAVNPDGKHAYVADGGSPGTVSVIDTATNKVVATVPVGSEPEGVAVTPDGKHAYVTNFLSGDASVIDTATNKVVGTPIPVGNRPIGVAITPDGKHAYVTNEGSDTVSVIATATNTVVATIPVGGAPFGVAITPDGKHAYVANPGSNTVSVIATATNTVVATVPVGGAPLGVAVTPDGKHAYVANNVSNNVSVIATASNTVVAKVPVGRGSRPIGVGIVPPPPGVPFLAFSANLTIDFDGAPAFNLHSQFTLSSTAPVIHPHFEAVTLQVGTFTTTIPPGSFTKQPDGSFTFTGVIGGVTLNASITPTGTLQYAFNASATGASLTGTKNEVYLTLIIGGDSGATSVTAAISP